MELKGAQWRRNPGEIRPITGDGTGEPAGQESGQKEPERPPIKSLKTQEEQALLTNIGEALLAVRRQSGGKELRE